MEFENSKIHCITLHLVRWEIKQHHLALCGDDVFLRCPWYPWECRSTMRLRDILCVRGGVGLNFVQKISLVELTTTRFPLRNLQATKHALQ